MIKDKKVDIIEIIIQVIFTILATIFIIQILLKLSGNSPTELQLLYVGFGSILGYLFFIAYRLGEVSQNVKMNNKDLQEVKYSFNQLSEKLNQLPQDINLKFMKIEKRLIKIESKI